jgi:hypothetical protein
MKHSGKGCSLALLATLLSLPACSLVESAETTQTKACVEDIKKGLNDPSSLEVLSKEVVPMDGGKRRIRVEFTAKNAVGGRVRATESCGFASEKAVTLDPEDFQNQMREMRRNFGAGGIRLR